MRVPHIIRIGALVIATTGFYTYVGQMVPQKEVQPPKETALGGDMTTADMVKVGREIMEGKGICLTCHTIGKTGALRFPDLEGIGARAKNRVPGLSDVEYLAQSMYEPTAFVVPGFPPAMPPVNQPPIGLTDQEILCVIAALQTLGGTPTVTLQTKHHYNSGAAPAGASPPAAPAKGAQLRPAVPLQPVTAHQAALQPDQARPPRSGRLRAAGASASLVEASAGAGGAKPRRSVSAPGARPAGAERGQGVPASDGDGGSGGAKPPSVGAPLARLAGAARGARGPASDGDGGSGGAKPPSVGAPLARLAGAARGARGPASDGDGGSGGAKPPGLIGAVAR